MEGRDRESTGWQRLRPRRWLRAVIAVILGLVLLPYAFTPLYAVVDPVSTMMLWRRLTGARVERHNVPLNRVSPALPLTVIIAEDGRFCSHHGVDLAGIREVIAEAEDLDEMRGGSTITQQLAKNLFLWQGRSYVRKALEFPLALWIDLVLSKRRIMEIYLNVVQWGPNGEFGVEAGARRAFGKSAQDLSRYQAALLAAALAALVGAPRLYRVWVESREQDELVTEEDVLADLEQAHAEGELDTAEMKRVRESLGRLGIELPRPQAQHGAAPRTPPPDGEAPPAAPTTPSEPG